MAARRATGCTRLQCPPALAAPPAHRGEGSDRGRRGNRGRGSRHGTRYDWRAVGGHRPCRRRRALGQLGIGVAGIASIAGEAGTVEVVGVRGGDCPGGGVVRSRNGDVSITGSDWAGFGGVVVTGAEEVEVAVTVAFAEPVPLPVTFSITFYVSLAVPVSHTVPVTLVLIARPRHHVGRQSLNSAPSPPQA